MINEYVHFNTSARNSIMERMTPDYMVIGIGSKTESYKYKSEIIADEQAFYKNEQAYMSDLCNKVLDGSVDRESFYSEIKDYLNNYYENRYELRNQPEVVETRVNHLIAKLQKMYGNIM